MFSLRGLRLYFPALEPWVVWSASLPCRSSRFICMNVGPRGATRRSACPVLHHSESGPLSLSAREVGLHGLLVVRLPAPFAPHSAISVPPRPCESSPPQCPSPPLLPVWMNVYFLFPWCRTPLPFDFLSVLVVRGGAVCLPTPSSWFSRRKFFNKSSVSFDPEEKSLKH